MKQTLRVLLAISLITALTSRLLFATDNTSGDLKQSQCPVMAGKVDKNIYTDYKGKRIYFCCSSCLDEFKKDPGKYMKEMQEKRITSENTP